MQRSRYRILGQVGQGQFGQVFCAVERETGCIFALKDLDMHKFPTHKFLRELSYLVSLRHPNIVSFHGLQHHQTGRYLVMDYCEGGTLRELMESEQTLSLSLILKLLSDLLSGLAHAHSRGIIHCDIKPENILLNINASGWTAKLSDFGIARWSEDQSQPPQTGGYTGSPAYMAPERFYGKYSVASDIYAVGILFYELLVGKRPFSGFPKDLMTAHLSQAVPMSNVIPPSLQIIIEKALRKFPQKRFSSSQEMLDAVHLACQELDIHEPKHQSFLTCFIEQESLKIKNQLPLSSLVSALAVSSQSIYLGIDHFLNCQIYANKNLLQNVILEYQLTLDQDIVKIEIRPTGCFIVTYSIKNNQYSLYFFFHRLTLEDRKLKKILSWSANQLMMTINEDGKWLAIASESHHFQVYSVPDFKLIKSSILSSFPTQILALDSSHGLLLTQQDNQKTSLQIFNRKGILYQSFSLPASIKLIALSRQSPYEFLALEANQPYSGLLICLKPLKITRIPLPIQASVILPHSSGYILSNALGKMLLLDTQGVVQGDCNLSAQITAITNVDDHSFLVATWSNNQGNLHQISVNFPTLRDGIGAMNKLPLNVTH